MQKTAELALAEESLSRARSIAEEQQKHTEVKSSILKYFKNTRSRLYPLDKLKFLRERFHYRSSCKTKKLRFQEQLRRIES